MSSGPVEGPKLCCAGVSPCLKLSVLPRLVRGVERDSKFCATGGDARQVMCLRALQKGQVSNRAPDTSGVGVVGCTREALLVPMALTVDSVASL